MKLWYETMGKKNKTKNDIEWERLFRRYDILNEVEYEGEFVITAEQIKEYREPRLMAKFDHSINLPKIFARNRLSILPISRREYLISHAEAYHSFEQVEKTIISAEMPPWIQSLNTNNITSETMAINCAWAAGILSDFLGEENLYPTVSGRMSSGNFKFDICNAETRKNRNVNVGNSQIEIDAAFEGLESLSLLEAKIDLSKDFLVRQLYYPFRVWRDRVNKKVKPIFLVYSNGIFSLYEYEFQDPNVYNSLQLVKHRNYSIEDTAIRLMDLQEVAARVTLVEEPSVSFPQANNFKRVINICELLGNHSMTGEEVTEEYAFDVRQTNYYTNAAIYLGLVEKTHGKKRKPEYFLSDRGKRIMNLNYKQRQLALCGLILQHRAFKDAFDLWMNMGKIPGIAQIVPIMEKANIYQVKSIETYERRASTILGWINWMFELIDEA